jgi:hypothetical protein
MRLTYRDVMLDWATSELLSPYWEAAPESGWSQFEWAAVRTVLRQSGVAELNQSQADRLLRVHVDNRQPILLRYGPHPDWAFERQEFSSAALGQLIVMPDFFPPGGSLLQLAQWIVAKPGFSPEKLAAVQAMAIGAQQNQWPMGTPIATLQPDGRLILVDGYKRAMAFMAVNRTSTPVVVARAPH